MAMLIVIVILEVVAMLSSIELNRSNVELSRLLARLEKAVGHKVEHHVELDVLHVQCPTLVRIPGQPIVQCHPTREACTMVIDPKNEAIAAAVVDLQAFWFNDWAILQTRPKVRSRKR